MVWMHGWKPDRVHALTLSLSIITLGYHVWTRKETRKEEEKANDVGVHTLAEAMRRCDKIVDIIGPIDIPSNEGQVSFMSFKMSHFSSKAYVTVGNNSSSDPTVHIKLQTIFEDNRTSISEEERYYIANDWNATKRYTRCKYNALCTSANEPGTFTLEYDMLLPGVMPNSLCLQMLTTTLTMWHTSSIACVLHIVNYKKAALPFATHGTIVGNTIEFQVSCADLMTQRCTICLENFQLDDWVRRLPCLHVFHTISTSSDCSIDTHLVRDKQCPICRTPIDVMDSLPAISKKPKPILTDAVVHLQARFNEFHGLVTNMRGILQQLRADFTPRADESPRAPDLFDNSKVSDSPENSPIRSLESACSQSHSEAVVVVVERKEAENKQTPLETLAEEDALSDSSSVDGDV